MNRDGENRRAENGGKKADGKLCDDRKMVFLLPSFSAPFHHDR